MLKKILAFVDGENLIFRYQDMLKNGSKPKAEVIHEPDSFVWHLGVTQWSDMDLIRVSYYTSVVGDEQKVADLVAKIASTRFVCKGSGMSASGNLIPRVSKKSANSKKTKVVDVNITMDVMRAALTMPVEGIYLLSGDADYLPLVRDVARTSKQIYVGAFSSGLGPGIKHSVDDFIDLDRIFFDAG